MEESFCRIADAPCQDHKELVSFILEGVALLDHTSIFLLRTINHRVILKICIHTKYTYYKNYPVIDSV